MSSATFATRSTNPMPFAKRSKENVLTRASPRRLQPGRLPNARWISKSDSLVFMRPMARLGRLGSHLSHLRSGRPRGRLRRATFCLALLSGLGTPATAQDSVAMSRSPKRFVFGATSSLLLHEARHVRASWVLRARPIFGFDAGRPTVSARIDAQTEPRKQFLFSSAGLNAQG